jgi:hypothetical protein
MVAVMMAVGQSSDHAPGFRIETPTNAAFLCVRRAISRSFKLRTREMV